MARRRRARSSAIVVRSAPPRYSAPRPIVIRAPATPARRRRRSKGGGGGFGGIMSGGTGIVAIAIAAAVIGLAEQSGIVAELPSIPLVRRNGALALGAYYYSKHGGGAPARAVATAPRAVCGYATAKSGSVC